MTIQQLQHQAYTCTEEFYFEVIVPEHIAFINSLDPLSIEFQAHQFFIHFLNELALSRFDRDIDLNVDTKVTFSEDITKDYKFKKVKFLDLYKLTNSKYNYSFSQFKNGYRKKDNYIPGNNCIALDIDDGWDLEKAIKLLRDMNVQALITTTKSHQIEKNGVICDRYRIIIPTSDNFDGTAEEYSDYYKEILFKFHNIPDPAPKDASRFWFGNKRKDAQTYYIFGEKLLTWEEFKPIQKKRRKEVDNGFKTPDKLIRWGIENIKVGERNNALYWVAKVCDEKGYNKNKVVNLINNSLVTPLPEKEINLIVR